MNIALIYYGFSLYSEFVMKQSEPYGPCCSCLSLLYVYGKTSAKRISLIGGSEKNAEERENSQKRASDNNVVIKHSQGPLISFQGL